jgi:transposase
LAHGEEVSGRRRPDAAPKVTGRQQRRRRVDAYAAVIDEMLRREPRLRASVIWERLVAEYGFDGLYQRVKLYVREARPRVCGEPKPGSGLHRRFEVTPGAQAQVDWGEEGEIDTPTGPVAVSSFHMTLSYSRDPSHASSPRRIWARSGTAIAARSRTSAASRR